MEIALTRCEMHQRDLPVEDMNDAVAAVIDQIKAGRQYGGQDIVAEVIAMSRSYRDMYPCCPAGSYATYLVDAATREVLAGESTGLETRPKGHSLFGREYGPFWSPDDDDS